MLDLKSLETFVWVVRLGGFRKAAERLNTTQPAISARVSQLEDELGVSLFDRFGRRVAPTSHAFTLLDYAEKMLALRAELLTAMADRSAIRGTIRLGVAETMVHTWLATLIERLNHSYPALSLEVEVDTSPAMRDALLRHELDIAFLLRGYTDSRFQVQPLCSYPLDWVASPDLPLPGEPVALTDLVRWPIITFSRTTQPYGVIRDLFAQAGLSQVRIFGNSSLATVSRMAKDGVGVSVIPPAIIARELQEGQLRRVRVDHPLPDLDFVVAYPATPDSHMAAAVASLAVVVAAEHSVR